MASLMNFAIHIARSSAWIKFEYCNEMSIASGTCTGGNELTFAGQQNNSFISNPLTITQNTTGNSITLIGTKHFVGPGTPGNPTFTMSGGTGGSRTSQTITSTTQATIMVNAGSALGTLTITDPSTGRTTNISVTAPLSSDATLSSLAVTK